MTDVNLPYNVIISNANPDQHFWQEWTQKRMTYDNLFDYLAQNGQPEPLIALIDILVNGGNLIQPLEKRLLTVGTAAVIEYYVQVRPLSLSSDDILSALFSNNEVVICDTLPFFIGYIDDRGIEKIRQWPTRFRKRKEDILQLYS